MWQCDHQICGRLYDANLDACPYCHFTRRHWEPTHEEIKAACERIREAWTETRERKARRATTEPLEVERAVCPGWRRVNRKGSDGG